VNDCSFRILPWGHGVPQLTPIGAAGGVSPSHFNSTDEADCAAAGKAQPATNSVSSVSDAACLQRWFVKAIKVNLFFIASSPGYLFRLAVTCHTLKLS
jgi:hypothetical protein